VALVKTNVSEESIASIIRVIRIEEIGTSAVTRNRRTLHHTVNIPEDVILDSHRRENFKSYIALSGWAL
jgi:hypothetical protein